jgi:tetratricopeptide (TPR) repeat protein
MWWRTLVAVLFLAMPLPAQEHDWQTFETRFNELCQKGDFLAAKALITEALQDRNSPPGLHHTGALLWLLSQAHNVLGEFDEADLRFRAAISALERAGRPAALTLARAQVDYAALIELRGGGKDAQRRRLAALEVLKRELGPGDPEVLRTQGHVALGFLARGDHERAERVCREVIESGQGSKRFPIGHLAEAYLILGKILLGRGRHADAAEAYNQATVTIESVYGPEEHPALLHCWVGVGIAHTRMRKFDSARELLIRAERVALEAMGPANPMVLQILTARCELLRAEGRTAEAKRLEKSARSLAREADNRRHSVSWAELNEATRP